MWALIIMKIETFYEGIHESVKIFDRFVNRYELKGRIVADHICYKCGSSDSFEKIRSAFETNSEWIYQSIISKRRIAIIRLNNDIETIAGKINLLELSDQKPDGSQSEGFDHIEVYPKNMGYDDLVTYLEEKGLEVNKTIRPHHTTHEVRTESGLIMRLTREPVLDIIKREQM